MSGFPAWYYYRDGRALVVKSQEELDALKPGWSDSPVGPWGDGFEGETPWEPAKGPFAQDTTNQRYSYPPSEPDGIYAVQPVCCNGWARNEGEVFRHEGTFEEQRLLSNGDVRSPVPPGRRFKHEPTGRWFLDEPTRDAYALRYEAGDVTGFVVDRGGPGKDTAVAAQDPATPRSRPGRPEDAEWRSWTFDELLEMLKSGWQQAQKKHPNKKRPSFQDVADCLGYARKPVYESLRSFNHTWETIRPFLQE
jgi:hypothetical protein